MSINFKRMLSTVLALVLLLTTVYMIPATRDEAEASTVGVTGVNVYMFHVGSGSCSIIEFKLNTGGASYTLVDAGSGYSRSGNKADYTTPRDNIKTFIKNKGITTFKYVILSHYDSDHMKMLNELIGDASIRVGQFICKKYSKTLPALKKAANTADQDGVFEQLTPLYNHYNEVHSIIAKKKSQGKLSNTEVLSPESGDPALTVGNYVKNASGQYTAVKVSLRFLNKGGSHFSGLYKTESNGNVTLTNKHSYDWREASNNDSLVFVMRYYDPSHYGDSSHVKKILYCGDIQSTAMAELVGKTYQYAASTGAVTSREMPTDISNTFKNYASDCDLIAGWPHHAKVLGAESVDNVNYTAFKDRFRTSDAIRNDFAKAVGKPNNATVCFVSTATNETIQAKANKWKTNRGSLSKAFDVERLVTFKDGGYYTNCITGGHALLSKFNVLAETQAVYACKSTATKYNERLINRSDTTYYNFNYNFFN